MQIKSKAACGGQATLLEENEAEWQGHRLQSVEEDHPRNKQVAVKDLKWKYFNAGKSYTIAVLCPTYMTDVKEVYRHASSFMVVVGRIEQTDTIGINTGLVELRWQGKSPIWSWRKTRKGNPNGI